MSLRDEHLQGAEIVARGTFKLDRRRAMDKLARFQLEVPHRYVLELVAAAVRGGATAIEVRNDSDDFEIGWDGIAPTAHELDFLFDHIFSASTEGRPRMLQHLAQGLFGAIGLNPSWVHIDRPGARYDLTDPLEPVRSESPRTEGVFVHVRERFGWEVVREFMNPLAAAEARLLRDDAWTCPVPLVVNGKDVRKRHRELALTPDGNAVVVVVRDGIVVQRETVTVGPLRLEGVVVADTLDLNASRSKVVRNSRWNALMAGLYKRVVTELKARGWDDDGDRFAGQFMLLHHLRHATPLASEPLFEDAARRTFSLEQLRKTAVYTIPRSLAPDPTWESPHFHTASDVQWHCLRERVGNLVDGEKRLADRHTGRARRRELARVAKPLSFGANAVAERTFQRGETRGCVALFGNPGMATIALRVDNLPVQSITSSRLPDGVRVRVGHPALKADLRFSRVLHEDPFVEVLQHAVDEGRALLLELARERPGHPAVRAALLNWLKQHRIKGGWSAEKFNELPEGLRAAPIWPPCLGPARSLNDLLDGCRVTTIDAGILGPDLIKVTGAELNLLRRLVPEVEDCSEHVQDLAYGAARRNGPKSAPTLPGYTTHTHPIDQDGLRGMLGLSSEQLARVTVVHQGVELGTWPIALPAGVMAAVNWEDARPNTRWDGLAEEQLTDLAVRLQPEAHALIRSAAAGLFPDSPLSSWTIAALEAGLIGDVPLFRSGTDSVSLNAMKPPVRVTTVAPSRPWPEMAPLLNVDEARRDVLKRCLGPGKVEDLSHRVTERNRQHKRFMDRPAHPYALRSAWGQQLFTLDGVTGVVGLSATEREGLRVAVLVSGRLLTTLAAPCPVPATAVVRGRIDATAGWDAMLDKGLEKAILAATREAADALVALALAERKAPDVVMRRVLLTVPAFAGAFESLSCLPLFRTMDGETEALARLQLAQRVWSVKPSVSGRSPDQDLWVLADAGVVPLLKKHVPSHADGTVRLKQLDAGRTRRAALRTESLEGVGTYVATTFHADGSTRVWIGLRDDGGQSTDWLVDKRVVKTDDRPGPNVHIRVTDNELRGNAAFTEPAPGPARDRCEGLIKGALETFFIDVARALDSDSGSLRVLNEDGARDALVRWLGQQPDRLPDGWEGIPLLATSDGRSLDAPQLAALARRGPIRVCDRDTVGRPLDASRPVIPAHIFRRAALHAYRGVVDYTENLARDEEVHRRREQPAEQPAPNPDAILVKPLPEPLQGFAEVLPDGRGQVSLHVGWRFIEGRPCPGPVPMVVHVEGGFTPDEQFRSIQGTPRLKSAMAAIEALSESVLTELLATDPEGRHLPAVWLRVLPRLFPHRRQIRRTKGTAGEIAQMPLFLTGDGDRLTPLQLIKLRKPIWVAADLAVPALRKDRPFLVVPPVGLQSTLEYWGGMDGTEVARARRDALARRQTAKRPWRLSDERWLAEREEVGGDWKVLAALHPGLGPRCSLEARVGGVPVQTWKEGRWPGMVGLVEVAEAQVSEDFHKARRTRAQDKALDALYERLVLEAAPAVLQSVIAQRRLATLLGGLSRKSLARRVWSGVPMLPGPGSISTLAEAEEQGVVFSLTATPDRLAIYPDPSVQQLLDALKIPHQTRRDYLGARALQARKQRVTSDRKEREAQQQALRKVLDEHLRALTSNLKGAAGLRVLAMADIHGLDTPEALKDPASVHAWRLAWSMVDRELVDAGRYRDAAEVAVRAAERILR